MSGITLPSPQGQRRGLGGHWAWSCGSLAVWRDTNWSLKMCCFLLGIFGLCTCWGHVLLKDLDLFRSVSLRGFVVWCFWFFFWEFQFQVIWCIGAPCFTSWWRLWKASMALVGANTWRFWTSQLWSASNWSNCKDIRSWCWYQCDLAVNHTARGNSWKYWSQRRIFILRALEA